MTYTSMDPTWQTTAQRMLSPVRKQLFKASLGIHVNSLVNSLWLTTKNHKKAFVVHIDLFVPPLVNAIVLDGGAHKERQLRQPQRSGRRFYLALV
jgi:hypothetical protein